MATNKNAVLRYNVLDKCFRNFGRTYTFMELLNVVNDALTEDDPKTSGIKTRQLREDLQFMRSDSGYGAPIVSYKDRGTPYYRYEDKKYSINNSPLNESEAFQLKNAISILQRFEGAPQFEWMQEILPLLNDQFGLKNDSKKVMAYESNVDYEGYRHISQLFNSIINERVLNITYQPFGQEESNFQFHPYFLKQYNNRWFVLGLNAETKNPTWNLALDRIVTLEETSLAYIPSDIDWEEHFYDFIGVSKYEGGLREVKLRFTAKQSPYVVSKPLHPSQKSTTNDDGTLDIRLKLIPNMELQMTLLSYGEGVEVLEPEELRETIQNRLKSTYEKYSK
jgi:predicted DNA-binding transcriptional regulator YafY